MTRPRLNAFRTIRTFCRERKGSTIALAAAMVPVLVGATGLTVDVGRAYAAKTALTSGTQAAALAGAYALAQTGATTTTVTNAVNAWNTAHPVSNVTITASTPTTSCVTATTGLPSCTNSSPNVVTVSQTGTVSTFFLRQFGRSSFTMSSTASAAKAGGTAQPLNIMFVVDGTGSMGDTDAGCGTVPGIASPSRWQCALYSIQSVMKVLPTAAADVGLMIFPGMGTQYSPNTTSCRSSNQPASVAYYTANIKYQINTTLDNTYNNGSSTLVSTSPMVLAVGNYKTSSSTAPCVTNKGGQGSYGAEAIAKAQAALPTNNGRQNVIIFLSDGEFNSSDFANGNSAKATDQCKQAVTNAQAATAANVTVYSVAYGALTTNTMTGNNKAGCYKDTGYTPANTPCTTMQAIASDSSKFFTTNTNCKINGTAPSVTQLPAIFEAIRANLATLTKPRLISN